MTDLQLRNEAQVLGPDPQENFNYWVRRYAFEHKIDTDEAQKQAIIKQEELTYTGGFYDFSEE